MKPEQSNSLTDLEVAGGTEYPAVLRGCGAAYLTFLLTGIPLLWLFWGGFAAPKPLSLLGLFLTGIGTIVGFFVGGACAAWFCKHRPLYHARVVGFCLALLSTSNISWSDIQTPKEKLLLIVGQFIFIAASLNGAFLVQNYKKNAQGATEYD